MSLLGKLIASLGMKICRYDDCPEGHVVGDDDDRITCPTCRKDLGLPALEESDER